MTDKQIIIHGVDVSGCKWFTHNQLCECAIKPADDFHCHANPNCYYKKWQYKEQECEELKKIIDEAKNSKLDLKSFLVGEAIQNEYEQQLDQLKAELTRANCQIADDEILQCDMREAIDQLKAENEELKDLNTRLDNQRETYWKGYQKLKQTLTEIKNKLTVHKTLYYESKLIEKLHKEILQKISEVEE